MPIHTLIRRIELISESDNPYAGVYNICGSGEFAATVPDPIRANKTISVGHFSTLEAAISARRNHLNQRDNRRQRRQTEFGESTTKAKEEEI